MEQEHFRRVAEYVVKKQSDLMGVSYTSTWMEHVDFRDSTQRILMFIGGYNSTWTRFTNG